MEIPIDCVDFCKVLADETRQAILEFLGEDEKNVSEIVTAFQVSQPTISHHLNLLRRYRLVHSRRSGKQVFYSLNRENVITCCGKLMAKFKPNETLISVNERKP